MNPKQRTEPKGPQRDLGGVCFTPNHAEHGSSPSPPDAGWLLLFVCPAPLKLRCRMTVPLVWKGLPFGSRHRLHTPDTPRI